MDKVLGDNVLMVAYSIQRMEEKDQMVLRENNI